MMQWIWLALAYVGAGIASGYLSGLFGVGGGVLRVPLFVYLFSLFGVGQEVVMHLAAGTSLALVVPSALTAGWKQHQMGKLDLSYYKTWGLSVFVGVLIGVSILPWITTRYLEGLFILFLVGVSLYVGLVPEHKVIAEEPPKGWIKGLIALFIGGFSVLIGIGGGMLTTPVMKACRMPIKNAIALATGTTLVVGCVGAIGAVIAGIGKVGRPPFSIGYVDLVPFAAMVLPVLVCAPLGAKTANLMDKTILRRIYAIFLLLMAIYMGYSLATS